MHAANVVPCRAVAEGIRIGVMRVATATLITLVVLVVFWVAAPIVGLRFVRRKWQIRWKPMWVGALTWLVMTQILEKQLHGLVLGKTAILQFPYVFALYGALAAGLFEEVGRYLAFMYLLPKARAWKDGLSYGIGHGGIEAILLGGLGSLQLLGFALLAITGKFEVVAGSLPLQAQAVITHALQTPWYVLSWGVVERALALLIQIGLTIVVLYGLRKKRLRYLVYAVLLHALADLGPALYQAKVLSLLVAEVGVVAAGAAAWVWITRLPALFNEVVD